MQQAGEVELEGEAEQSGDMAVGQGAASGDGLVGAREGDAALEDGVDGVGRELGEIGDGLAADALALAPGLAEQDGRGAVAIGDGLDVEGHGRITWKQLIPIMILIQAERASQVKYYMETKIHMQEALGRLELIAGKALMSEKICLIYVKFSLVPRRFFDDDRVAHWSGHSPFSPACFMMLAQVPRVRSSPSLPAMVTVPGSSGCRY